MIPICESLVVLGFIYLITIKSWSWGHDMGRDMGVLLRDPTPAPHIPAAGSKTSHVPPCPSSLSELGLFQADTSILI